MAKRYLLTVIAPVLVIFSLLPNQPRAGIINGMGAIAAKHSGKCLDVPDGSTANGVVVVQNTCQGNNHQKWALKPFLDAYQVIVNHSGKCLNVSTASLADGAEVIQWPCTGNANELWYARPKGDYFQLVAKHSGKCLNVFGATQNNAGKIIQWPCKGANNELWNIATQSHTPIVAKHSNQCIDVAGESTAEGAGIVQFPCHGRDNQQWTLMPYQDAYRLFAKHNGQCLTVSGASLSDGAQIVQSTCSGVDNELWYPSQVGKYYKLVAKHSNKCLTVNAGSTSASEGIIQNTCLGVNYQLWKLDINSTTGGKWSDPIALSLVPVAAASLPDGKLLLWSSHDRFSFGGGGETYTAIFDPETNVATERLVQETGHDMFCPGTSNLPDGRILVNGGVNSTLTSIYDPATEQWSLAQAMNIGRGYQANTVLSNGEVFTLGGSWSGGVGLKDAEVWNPETGWRKVPNVTASAILTDDPQGIYRSDNHGWFFSGGNQKVFHAGPSKQMNWFGSIGAGSSTPAGNRGADDHSMNGNAAMYGIGKIVKMGGAPAYQNSVATTKAYVIDINNGVKVQQSSSLAYARAFNSSVSLPNGQVIVFGGQSYAIPFTDAQPVFAAELWNPTTGTFTTLASMSIPRTYHSVALLMPDARVFVAGGGLCGTCTTNHADAEIFTPPYLLNSNGTEALRPIITDAPADATYGAAINVTTNAAINSFAFVRLSSITHTVNNDQRRIPLTFSKTETVNKYQVNIPSRQGVVTPGYYMLFAMNSAGVPSKAKIIKVG